MDGCGQKSLDIDPPPNLSQIVDVSGVIIYMEE